MMTEWQPTKFEPESPEAGLCVERMQGAISAGEQLTVAAREYWEKLSNLSLAEVIALAQLADNNVPISDIARSLAQTYGDNEHGNGRLATDVENYLSARCLGAGEDITEQGLAEAIAASLQTTRHEENCVNFRRSR